MEKVPNFDFTSLNFAAPIPKGQDNDFCFTGPSQKVERVAAAVAAQGQILPISAPAPNASWNLDFWAPALQCHDVEGVVRDNTLNHILDQWGNVSDCSHAYGYMAWTGTSNSTLPFVQQHANSSRRVLQADALTYGAPASIYVATLPQMFNFAFMSSNAQTQEKCRFFGADGLIYTYPMADDVCLPGLERPLCYGQQAWFTDATLLRCDLVNSSYTTEFKYTDGTQLVDISTNKKDVSVPITAHQCFTVPDGGKFSSNSLKCNGTGTACQYDEVASRLLSYQSIAHAFNQLILGSITMGGYGTPAKGVNAKAPGIVIDSEVATTVLMDTEELAFVADFNGVNETFVNLQMEVNEPNSTATHGISDKTPTGQRGDLKSALETLFQNITISLLTESYLQPNYSSPYAPAELTQVTFNRYHNVYIYSASTLWVAYGLAILFTVVALGLGLTSMVRSNASFANNFSTVVVTSRTAPMTDEVRQSEGDGRQPLSKRLAEARMMIGVSERRREESTSAWNYEREPASETSLLPPIQVDEWPLATFPQRSLSLR